MHVDTDSLEQRCSVDELSEQSARPLRREVSRAEQADILDGGQAARLEHGREHLLSRAAFHIVASQVKGLKLSLCLNECAELSARLIVAPPCLVDATLEKGQLCLTRVHDAVDQQRVLVRDDPVLRVLETLDY